MTWKHLLIAIVTILILNYASGVFKERIERKVETRQELEREVAVLETYVQSSDIQNNSGALFRALPASFDQIQVRQLFDKWESSANVTFDSIQSNESSQGDSQLATGASVNSEQNLFRPAVNVRKYQITVEGSFTSQIQLLKELESAQRFVSVKELSFQEQRLSEEGRSTMTNQLVIELYYQDNL